MKHWTCNSCGKKNKVGVICPCKPDDVREELIKFLKERFTTIMSMYIATEILSKFELRRKVKKS